VRKTFYLLLLFVLLLSACAAQSLESSALQGTWKLTQFGSSDVMMPAVEDANASLTFADDGTVSGSGGCNSLGGTYEVKDSEITFGPITSTLMACDDTRNAQESFVTQSLTGTAHYEVKDQTLIITNGDKVLVFSK